MSVKAVAWAYEQRVGDPVKKSILVAIADVADDEGFCWPSVALIAFKSEVHPRTVQRHLRTLERLGFLVVDRERVRDTGASSSNGYQLPILAQSLFQGGEGGRLPPPGKLSPPAQRRGEGGTGVTPYEPSLEPYTPSTRARGKSKPIPEDFGISEAVRAWAKENGFEPYLEAHLAYFLDWARGADKRYVDWDATFRNAIRADWGDVRKGIQRSTARVPSAPAATHLCVGCGSPRVTGSYGKRWHCGADACRDKAAYGDERRAA